KNYVSLSILDWRNTSQQEKIEAAINERGINLQILSLTSGEFELVHSKAPEEPVDALLNGTGQRVPTIEINENKLSAVSKTKQQYISYTGRFGLTSKEHDEITSWAKTAASRVAKKSDKALVIGVGENMYLPIRFALALGGNSRVQTTTRSPIFAAKTTGYPIQEKAKFNLPDAEEISQFIYNLNELDIDRIYLLAESVVKTAEWQPLLAYLEEKASVEWISLTTTKRSEEIE
ncbi:MAG: TRSP domain-containing protein, partial [Planococcus donghaensis]